MDFSHPPPDMSAPPPINPNNFSFPNIRPHFGAGKPGQPFFKPFNNFVNRGQYGHHNFPMTQDDFDGKRLRKSVMRKTVDYNASICKTLQVRRSIFWWVELTNFIVGFCFQGTIVSKRFSGQEQSTT